MMGLVREEVAKIAQLSTEYPRRQVCKTNKYQSQSLTATMIEIFARLLTQMQLEVGYVRQTRAL
jgi:hypothetical protein